MSGAILGKICSFSRSIRVLSLISTIAAGDCSYGCGITWLEPRSHFEGVDSQGTVSIVKVLGNIQGGEGKEFPIFAIFNAKDQVSSPYLGFKWKLPLLESKIVQIDENTFRLDQPDGWYRFFWRDRKDPNVLNGQGDWKAVIQGNTVTAWADCGTKLVFNSGRISSMQIKDRQFTYTYLNQKVSEVRESDRPVVTVISDPRSGEVEGLRLQDQTIEFTRGQVPRVQTIDNMNVVAGMESAVSGISTASEKLNFEYGVDSIINPTIQINDRLITWKAKTGEIVSDGDMLYKIQQGSGKSDNAFIARTNLQGKSESWFYDSGKGRETIEKNGKTTIRSWYTSGKLHGKSRRVIEVEGGKQRVLEETIYDEEGRILRELKNTVQTTKFKYDGDRVEITYGTLSRGDFNRKVIENGKLVEYQKLK